MPGDVKILVVDDDPYLLDLLIETLKTIGYNAIGASRAQEALTLLNTTDIQLVITDIKMPEMDGIEFTRQVKKNHPDLPVIFITGVLGSSILKNGHAEGFLAKPFRIGRMEELIESALSGTPGSGEINKKEQVLVVDDDDTFRLMLIESLKLSGYAVAGASGGREAVAILESGRIGAVITDVQMPEMDGIALSKYIKENWPEIPVIMITGYVSLEDQPIKKADVADGFLMKPFKIESITELLENLKKERIPPA